MGVLRRNLCFLHARTHHPPIMLGRVAFSVLGLACAVHTAPLEILKPGEAVHEVIETVTETKTVGPAVAAAKAESDDVPVAPYVDVGTFDLALTLTKEEQDAESNKGTITTVTAGTGDQEALTVTDYGTTVGESGQVTTEVRTATTTTDMDDQPDQA